MCLYHFIVRTPSVFFLLWCHYKLNCSDSCHPVSWSQKHSSSRELQQDFIMASCVKCYQYPCCDSYLVYMCCDGRITYFPCRSLTYPLYLMVVWYNSLAKNRIKSSWILSVSCRQVRGRKIHGQEKRDSLSFTLYKFIINTTFWSWDLH